MQSKINEFIVKNITKRKLIDLENDIIENYDFINSKIFQKKVLVIGGAGTIGSHYIKQILRFKPKTIVVVDINENALTEITRDLRSSKLLDYKPEYITYPVNLLSNSFERIFKKNNFDIVANFAAHKHVRSEKDSISIEAMIENNILGCIRLLKLCEKQKPKFFFCVSTDKAANPVNVMGATKLFMENLILSKKFKFRVTTARFANVAFSNGSLLESFINRINKNQPISCPSDIKRFFVSPTESGQICLLSTFLGNSGNIFFPKLDFINDQIYFKDILNAFLKFNGYKPVFFKSEINAKQNVKLISKKSYPIYLFKSDTSGEKKYEEFFTKNENINTDKFKSLGFIESSSYDLDINEIENDFIKLFSQDKFSKLDTLEILKRYLHNFNHIETGKQLDQKM